MARLHIHGLVLGYGSRNGLTPQAATVNIYKSGTSAAHALSDMWNASTAGANITSPLTAGANGQFDFWMDNAHSLDLVVSAAGFNTKRLTVDCAPHNGVDTTVSGTSNQRTVLVELSKTNPQPTDMPEFGES